MQEEKAKETTVTEEEKQKKEQNAQKQKEEKKKPLTLFTDLSQSFYNFKKIFAQKETVSIQKAIKKFTFYKKHLKAHHFKQIWTIFSLNEKYQENFDKLNDFNKDFTEQFLIQANLIKQLANLPELEIICLTMLINYYLFTKQKVNDQYIIDLCQTVINKINALNKRYLDQIKAFVYQNYSRALEIQGKLKILRKQLFEEFRLSCLNKDEIGQAYYINLLLRNYIFYKQYFAADNLISKTTFPENQVNNQDARYYYYTGKIKAIQLKYQDAFTRTMMAIRKAPDSTALGFKIQAQKLAIVIELLLGEIPNKSIFQQPEHQKYLVPYFFLIQSVVQGNLQAFENVVKKYQNKFSQDGLYQLINRLHTNVIKTGLKKIERSYSRISLDDIQQKLAIDKNLDIEFIIAKAISTQVIDAKIDHENRHLIIAQTKDIYSSDEPFQAFQKRIQFCLQLYNQAVQALQFPEEKKEQKEKLEEEDIDLEELQKLVEEDFEF